MTQANCAVLFIIFSNDESYDTPAGLVTSAHCIIVTATSRGTVIPTLLGG